jgi:hypothetical protein
MRHSALLLPLLLVSTAQACLNDRDSDSLAIQAKKLPDTLRVITGRFERNPPLYYEMRIRRALPQLKQSPRQFDLYDDIAVAYDRLHRDDEALQVMEQKRSLLPRFDAKDKAVKEAWYRYYANAGTFYAHRWLGAGAKKESLAEMKKGRDYIKRALQIKPNAHFGREKYQLMTMEWIIATRERKGGAGKTLAEWIAGREGQKDYYDSPVDQAKVEGLAGLVVLGAAWQSPDMFEAMAGSLRGKGGTTLQYMTLLRCRELLRSGKKSLSPTTLNENVVETRLQGFSNGNAFPNTYINDKNQQALSELYPKLRSEADMWAGKRSIYMLANLEKGLHPDTTPNFWNNWKPAAAPDMNIRWWNDRTRRYEGEVLSQFWNLGGLWILGGTLAATFLALRIMSKRRQPKTALQP